MANPELNTALQQQIDQARQRGTTAAQQEPRAVTARYDPASDRLCIDLNNGVGVLLPRRLLQGLAEATTAQLESVTISPSGYGLSWEALDVDLAVPQLIAGIFGTARWMTELRLTDPSQQNIA